MAFYSASYFQLARPLRCTDLSMEVCYISTVAMLHLETLSSAEDEGYEVEGRVFILHPCSSYI